MKRMWSISFRQFCQKICLEGLRSWQTWQLHFMCMLTVNSVLIFLLQVWEYMGRGPDEVLDQMIRAAHRSLLGGHIQACMDIIRWLRPFTVSLDPDSG